MSTSTPKRSRQSSRRLLCALLIAAPGLIVATPAAADDVQDALKLLDEGIKSFRADKLEEARTAFFKVSQIFPDKANPYRWLGLTDARLGHCPAAVKNLDEFLKRVPETDPRTIEAVTVRDRCKEEMRVKAGTLIVESTPPGAMVRIDQEGSAPVGVTPYRDDKLVIGAHVVFLGADGYEKSSKAFTLGEGETVRLDVVLEKERPIPVVPTGSEADQAEPAAKRPYWIIGVVAGVAAAAVGVGLGVGLTRPAAETTFDAVRATP